MRHKDEMPKTRIAIVGLGFIGGSIGLALKKSKLELEVIGHEKDPSIAARAQKRGAVDGSKWNLIDACDGAGLIILALPLNEIKSTLEALKPNLSPGVIVTDTATTKVPVMEWAQDLPDGAHFVGGDPILKSGATAQDRGIDAADANAFRGATYCLTAAPTASASAVETLTNLVALLGAQPYFVEAAEHDGLMAGVQHLPALLATALASTVIQSQGWRERAKLAGSDFRTVTNLVPADGKIAREQFLAHRTDLLRWIDAVMVELHELRDLFAREDADALAERVEAIAAERGKWLSGSYDETTAPADMESVQTSTARLFFGGLLDRPKKTKS